MFKARQLTFDKAQQGFPGWSPDGDTILIQRSDMYDTIGKNGLWKISLDGKYKKQVFSGLAEHPSWSPHGDLIVFDADTGNNMKMIAAAGGVTNYFLPDSIKIQRGGMPVWSPDGRQIAFLEGTSLSLCVFNIETGSSLRIFSKDGYVPMPGCWSPDGKYILAGLMELGTRKSGIVKISPDGQLMEEIQGHHENFYRHLDLSPDGTLLVYSALVDGALGLYIMSLENGINLPLSITPGNHNEGPCWSPDGTKLAFTSTRSGNHNIWIMDIDIEEVKKQLLK